MRIARPNHRASLAALLIAGAALMPACYCRPPAGTREPQKAPSARSAMRKRFASLRDEYYWAQLGMEPPRAVRLGYHQYDGKLPAVQPALLQRHEQRLRAWLHAFEHEIDVAALTPTERLERESVLYEIRGGLFAYEQREPFRNPLYYVGALGLTVYIARPYADLPTRARGVIAIARATPAYLAQADANLDPRIPRAWIEAAHKQYTGLIDFVRDDVVPAMPGLDAALAKELRDALAVMAEAVQRFDAALQARLPDATSEYALGEAALLRMLAMTQGVGSTLPQLEQVARDDVAANMRALQAEARAIDPRRPVREVVAEVVADKPAIADVVAVASEQATRARAFVAARDLVTIPYQSMPEVRETPPYMRFNIAFLEGSGPFEKAKVRSFYYISPPDPSWPPEQQQQYVPDRASLASITVHELWPGHYLQALHMKKQRSPVLRTFRNYATSEGWAHYCEQLMAEQGWDGERHFHVGQLVMALVRDVRFLAALGLHARGMSVDQAAALFREQAFQDAGNAEQQAARGTFDPMYLSYTLGKLMILKLRADYRARIEASGQAFSLREFHDRFLSYGAVPIPVIRREMLGPDAGPAL